MIIVDRKTCIRESRYSERTHVYIVDMFHWGKFQQPPLPSDAATTRENHSHGNECQQRLNNGTQGHTEKEKAPVNIAGKEVQRGNDRGEQIPDERWAVLHDSISVIDQPTHAEVS